MRNPTFKATLLAWEPLVAVLILLGAATDWATLPKAAEASAYHRLIRETAARLPLRIGNWVGRDVPVHQGAIAMLHPNVIISRQYVDSATGTEASVLLVQCGDARDIEAHYPPVCFVNSGWTLIAAAPHDWVVGATVFTGTEYQFAMRTFDRPDAITVSNFILLPDGRIARDMDAVAQAADDVSRRYFGAAQVQVVTAAELPQERRQAVVVELIGAMEATIGAIRAGAIR